MTACPACQREVPEERKDCPYCGVVFAKWKGHKSHELLQLRQAIQRSNRSMKTPSEDSSILQKEVCVERFSGSWNEKVAQAYSAQLNAWYISHRIQEPDRSDDWVLSWDVYVPVEHLFRAKALNILFHKGLTLPELCNQPVGFRKKVLTNALAFVADKTGPFKRSLFSDESLAWYQRYSGMNDKEMQSAFVKAPKVYRIRATVKTALFLSSGVACIAISWKDAIRDAVSWIDLSGSPDGGPWAVLILGAGLIVYGVRKTTYLARSEKWS